MTTRRRTLELTARVKDAERRSIQLLAETERIRDKVMANMSMLGEMPCKRCKHPLNYHTYSNEKIGCDIDGCKCNASMGDDYGEALERLEDAKARVAELEAALKPFAELSDFFSTAETLAVASGLIIRIVGVQIFRAAAAALASKGA